MELSNVLVTLRKEKRFTQQQLAEVLSKRGCPIKFGAISRWEQGTSTPDAEQLLLLCELYGIRDVLAVFRGYPTQDAFSALNAQGRKRALEYIELLSNHDAYARHAAPEKHNAVRSLPLYDLPVSAGTGLFLDSEHYELLDVDDSVPISATFAVRVRGDSMQPRIFDQQILYIKQQQTLDHGELGIFMLNGDAYCKQYMGNALISLNTNYNPIHIGMDDEFRIIGKVVG